MHENVAELKTHLAGSVTRDQVELACKILEDGGVIALPTDTVYGLAAKVDNAEGLEKIYRIKGRDPSKPLSVCVSNIDRITEVAEVGQAAQRVLHYLLPGQVTILFNRSPDLNKDLNPGLTKVGVRVPNHNFIMAITHYIGPLALTSANRSGDTSAIEAEEFQELWSELDYVFTQPKNIDPAPLSSLKSLTRSGSTVVDLSECYKYKIIREGCSADRTKNLLSRFGYKKL